MTRNFARVILAWLLSLTFLASLFAAADAQSPTPATPAPVVAPASTGDVIAFSQLLKSDMTLTGPFDSNALLFAVPAGWRLTPGVQLNLAMAVSFNVALNTNVPNNMGTAGTLTIQVNNVLLGVISLSQVGEVVQNFKIPLEAMKSARADGLMEIRFTLDSGWACTYNENMMVSIHTTSTITLPHDLVAPDTDLANFPSPIFQQNSAFPSSALIVVPDNPSAAELQSAMTVAAGMGNLTAAGLALDMTTASQLTPQQAAGTNLILVGKASSMSGLLQQLQLPMPVAGGQLKNSGGGADDGIIQMVDSPWSTDKAVLVISGNTDAGTLKAAQAMSTGVFRANTFPNLSIVQQVQENPLPVSVPVDQTLQDLGYGTETATSLGVNYINYSFYIPPGQTLGPDAYFELQYGHSALLNYSRSGIVVLLNGQPIGSVAFNATTAGVSINSAKFTIPSAVAHAGKNNIEIRVNMIPLDLCTQPNLSGTYTNIWPGSTLHLPLSATTLGAVETNFDLSNYPAPFTYDSTLSSTAFVLPKNDLQAWRAAVGVAMYLGSAARGSITTLGTFYADNVPAADRANYNLLVIGRASQLPIISEINNSLPAPFAVSSDLATEPAAQVIFRIAPDTTVGYVELLSSPWNGKRVLIAALGNTEQGVIWAASHLIAPLSFTLKGNFAVINDTKVSTTDTRIASIAPLAATAVPNGAPPVQAIPPAVNVNAPAPVYRPAWILPAIIVGIVLILITISAAVYLNWLHNHPGKTLNPFEDLLHRGKEK
jgi:hypothetical protein